MRTGWQCKQRRGVSGGTWKINTCVEALHLGWLLEGLISLCPLLIRFSRSASLLHTIRFLSSSLTPYLFHSFLFPHLTLITYCDPLSLSLFKYLTISSTLSQLCFSSYFSASILFSITCFNTSLSVSITYICTFIPFLCTLLNNFFDQPFLFRNLFLPFIPFPYLFLILSPQGLLLFSFPTPISILCIFI